MSGIRPVTMVVAIASGVVLLSAIVAWRRVVLRDRLVLDRSRPYIHQSVVIRRLMNPINVTLDRKTVLVVRGRRSGKPRRVPMDPPFEHEGRRYLVSPNGDTNWARNLRAAGEAELRLDGHQKRIRALELEGPERDAIVTAYAAGLTCHCRVAMAKLPHPADHPAFRIEPLETVNAPAA